jgi:Holliday junction resolvase-like predicted endonuclease
MVKVLQHWADEKWWLQDNYVAAYAGKLSAGEIDRLFFRSDASVDAQWEARTEPHPGFQYLLPQGLLPLQSIVSVGRHLRAVENCSNFKRVRDDLRNPRDYDSAVVELSVAAILAEAGYEITFRPRLPNGKEADLLAKCSDQEVFFEIKIMHEAQSTEAVRAFTDGLMFTLGDFLRRRGGDELAFRVEVDSEIESMLGAGPTVDQDVVRGLLRSTLKNVEQNLTRHHYEFVIPHIGYIKFGSTTEIENCGISSPGPHPGLELRRIMQSRIPEAVKQLPKDRPGVIVIRTESVLDESQSRLLISSYFESNRANSAHVSAVIFVPMYYQLTTRWSRFPAFTVTNPVANVSARDLGGAYNVLVKGCGFCTAE